MTLITLFFVSQLSMGSFSDKQKNFTYDSFKTAEKSQSFVRFDMQSTLIGFLTARFSGFAKNFDITWKQDSNSSIKDLAIQIPVSFMDTNREGRTKEMQNDSLEMFKYPMIEVSVPSEFKLEAKNHKAQGVFMVRGKEIKKDFPLNIDSIDERWKVSGEFIVKPSEMNIISPTIARGIASFEDEVYLRYQFTLIKIIKNFLGNTWIL